MNTKCLGKISRLPGQIRQQLNERMRNSEEGNRLVAWLNSLPEVTAPLSQELAPADQSRTPASPASDPAALI